MFMLVFYPNLRVAIAYHHGTGAPNDEPKAIEWYKKAVAQNHIEATYDLASCYLIGQCTKPDIEEALKLMDKAAKAGYSNAQFELGTFYNEGIGSIKQDKEEAAKWFKKVQHQSR